MTCKSCGLEKVAPFGITPLNTIERAFHKAKKAPGGVCFDYKTYKRIGSDIRWAEEDALNDNKLSRLIDQLERYYKRGEKEAGMKVCYKQSYFNQMKLLRAKAERRAYQLFSEGGFR
tara:strand:- start:363 stop:713 length:351 start_codon:yes stop_codon:yes gene_type:complete